MSQPKDGLHTLEELDGDERWMLRRHLQVLPAKTTHVKRIRQYSGQVRCSQRSPVAGLQSALRHQWPFGGIDHDLGHQSLALDPIASGRQVRPATLKNLLPHSLLGFLGEVRGMEFFNALAWILAASLSTKLYHINDLRAFCGSQHRPPYRATTHYHSFPSILQNRRPKRKHYSGNRPNLSVLLAKRISPDRSSFCRWPHRTSFRVGVQGSWHSGRTFWSAPVALPSITI